ncbi:MAG: insulinase family protein [Deltaproteobacteria bacterium]|nr:insulinase family protein [Deltaproteobacteria bacterium]
MKNIFIALLALSVSSSAALASGVSPRFVLMKSSDLPITTFNITFRVGSADDPKGDEGLANLTARMLREGGVAAATIAGMKLPARTRAELEDFLFPLSADIGVSAEKEQVSLSVTSTGADAETVFGVLAQLILAPAFAPAELDRLKAEELDALSKQLPREDQEELGKAALDQVIYGPSHPYAHVVQGTVKGVGGVTIDKVREFYRSMFTRRRLTVGIAGVVSPRLLARAKAAFGKLPEGTSDRAEIPAAPAKEGVRLTIVKGPFDAVGAHLGQPIPLNRASPEFGDLYLASWAFGKHRSFVGRLMSHVREIRGLNYGTYSYAEDFPAGGHHLSEPTQAARTRQAFTVWARPTTMPNGCFLLRQIYRETNLLATEGLTKAEFDLTKSHLVGNAPLLATGLERRLGYAVDSVFYGLKGDYLARLQKGAQAATHARVNAVIKKYLHPDRMDMVVVTPDPDKYREQVLGAKCEISYASGVTKAPEVLAEDKVISTYPLGLAPERISVISSESVFDK